MNTEDDEFKRVEREARLRRAREHHDPIGDAQAKLIAEQAAQIQPGYQALQAAHTRLQKRYGELEAKQPAPVQEHVADGLIRQYINSLVLNKPDEAANVTKAMVDYVYTTPQPAQQENT